MEGGSTPGSAARRVMHLTDEAERQTAHAAREAPEEAAAAEAQRGAPAQPYLMGAATVGIQAATLCEAAAAAEAQRGAPVAGGSRKRRPEQVALLQAALLQVLQAARLQAALLTSPKTEGGGASQGCGQRPRTHPGPLVLRRTDSEVGRGGRARDRFHQPRVDLLRRAPIRVIGVGVGSGV
eukprot:scaffold38271_cov29-Phaeocystis_antarctica.AAC.1